MDFPYPVVRPSQQQMMDDITACLAARKHLVMHAPTGLGKTITSLYPAVRYALEHHKTVYFLTGRLSQHRAAIIELRNLRETHPIVAVDLVGKQHLCSFETGDLDASSFSSFCSAMVKNKTCEFYQNFKAPDQEAARALMLTAVRDDSPLPSQRAKQIIGGRYCSYEMLMEIAAQANVVVGDYFHLFSPLREKLLKRTGKKLEDAIIIVDEAHGLGDRLRQLMSAQVSTWGLELAEKEARDFGEHDIAGHLNHIRHLLFRWKHTRLARDEEALITLTTFRELVEQATPYTPLMHGLTSIGERVLRERKTSHCERVAEFLQMWEGEDFGFARIAQRDVIDGSDRISIQYLALDPSLLSRKVIGAVHSVILMSGTMAPMEMHRDILGCDPDRTLLRAYDSPFPPEHRLDVIVPDVTTRFTDRNSDMYARIARTITVCTHAVRGNTAVFFPSYDMQQRMHRLVASTLSKEVVLEVPGMKKDERDNIIESMKQHADRGGAVLFGVMGGSFSEGIDLPGNLLNGVIVIGLPLARPTLREQALVRYYDNRFAKGLRYAYYYPAIIKVLQAAGRCIRSETDRGVCIFCDARFIDRKYRSLFPPDFDAQVTDRPELLVKEFFSRPVI